MSAQLAGYTLIEKDLRSVGIWLAEIDEIHSDGPMRKGEHYAHGSDRKVYNVIKGLFVAALTFYGKSFSRCEGRPVKLERAQLGDEFRLTHDQCMKFRHNFAAHSGAARLEHVAIALVLPLKAKRPVLPKLYRELFQPDLVAPSQGEVQLAQLVQHARSIAVAKIELLSAKILKDEVYPMGQDYWLRK